TSPLTRWANTALVFAAVVFAWIFFRAETISDALAYIGRIFTTSLIANPVAEVWLQGGRPSHLYLALA
ncbi:MAG: hypothetical protein GWM88_07070, partial [Pseudomonadales bacterium]|nr:hypothetical protein [Pseudomonadales bacterium]NIX07778.1 hypothetical protein [Pseudomonadales bacterium]